MVNALANLISVVIPLYNEEENVPILCDAIASALAHIPNYEVILVNDGSSDNTLAACERQLARHPSIRCVDLGRNSGQTAAMAAGIEVARGNIIVTMDGDLQNDPADIPRLIAFPENGYDIAVGWRRKRKDGAARVLLSQVANRCMGRVLGVAVRDSGCSLKAFKGELIKGIPLYGEMHRFIPALCSLAGARLAEIEVNHRPRKFGQSKYGFSRIHKVLFDIIAIRALLSYARRPLRWIVTPLMATFVAIFGVLALSLAAQGTVTVVMGGVVLIIATFAFFLIAWGLLGMLFAQIEPQLAEYAAIATGLGDRSGRSSPPEEPAETL